MKTAWNIVYWEILKKNRAVFPTLGLMLLFGGAMAVVCQTVDPDSTLVMQGRRMTLLAFFISLLIAFTPFLLVESGGGWRMNSMITRWFTLPVATPLLVYVPLVTACLFHVALIALWVFLLSYVEPGLDGIYLATVLVTAQVLFNAIAWTVPRKPLQFWTMVAITFPIVLLLAFGPQDQPDTEIFRQNSILPLGGVVMLLLLYAKFAADRNRSGRWPGEIPLRWPTLPGRTTVTHRPRKDFRSTAGALFAMGSLPTLRMLVLGWTTFCVAVLVYGTIVVTRARPEQGLGWWILPMVAVGVLPVLAVPVMALWGLFAGGEPAAAFRTRLTGFKATLPIDCGQMAAEKLLLLWLGWLLIWVPLVGLSYCTDPALLGLESENMTTLQLLLARLMTVTAFLLAGSLPFLLSGRFEGFPNVLLAGVCSWFAAWLMSTRFQPQAESISPWMWVSLAGVLVLKLGLSVYAFVRAVRDGHTRWRFVLLVSVAWLLTFAFISFVLPVYRVTGLWGVGCMAALLPIARLAWAPLAIAANRHR